MDIKNVIVPTDFSLPSRMAINYGVALARKFHARITLVHVLEPVASPEHMGAADLLKIERKQREDALENLSSLLAPEDEDDLDLRVVLKAGNVREEIATAIREHHADIAVLGTHGRRRLGRLVVGSTTESLLRKLPIPVLTVSHAIRPMGFERILFATDLSQASARGFAFALDIAKTLQAGILAVHVLPTIMPAREDGDIAAEAREIALAEARRKLSGLVTEGRRHDVTVQTLLTEGPAAPAILKAAEESNVDLILATIEEKSALKKALVGTTAEQVIREANVPVLCVPVHALDRGRVRETA